MSFRPENTSTQRLDRGWARKMGEEVQLGFPSQDYVVKGPMSFKTITNIYTGKAEKVLVDPVTHDGFVTKQQRDALQKKTSLGPGVRITLEGNIGSGKRLNSK